MPPGNPVVSCASSRRPRTTMPRPLHRHMTAAVPSACLRFATLTSLGVKLLDELLKLSGVSRFRYMRVEPCS
jgi:hypothetical protein